MTRPQSSILVPRRVSNAYFAERFTALIVKLLQSPCMRSDVQEIAVFLDQNRGTLLKFDAHCVQKSLPTLSDVIDDCQKVHTFNQLARMRYALKCAQIAHLFAKQTSMILNDEHARDVADKMKVSGLGPETPQPPPPKVPRKSNLH